jgi:hypothetical protein
MQKIFGIAVIVGLIWIGLSLFTEGTTATFGWLPWVETPEAPEEAPLDRLRARGEAARDAQMDRIDRQLEPEPTDDE